MRHKLRQTSEISFYLTMEQHFISTIKLTDVIVKQVLELLKGKEIHQKYI